MDLISAKATMIFLAANVILSVIGFASRRFIDLGLLNVAAIKQRQDFHRLLTSGFLHVDPMHLFVNMITLFFFGPELERLLGSQNFFLVYLGALIIGNIGAYLRHFNDLNYRALGASGAVSGVMFAYCLFQPFQTILVFGLIPLPTIVYAFLFVAYSIYGMKAQNDNIGHDAHLFGAVGGILITILIMPTAITDFFSQIATVLG